MKYFFPTKNVQSKALYPCCSNVPDTTFSDVAAAGDTNKEISDEAPLHLSDDEEVIYF
jgi:hypothetical protein